MRSRPTLACMPPRGVSWRLPVKVWVYGREDQVSARIANTLSMTDAEKLAKYIARTLTDAWGGRKLEPPDPDE